MRTCSDAGVEGHDGPPEDPGAERSRLGPPAGGDEDGAVGLGRDGRAGHRRALGDREVDERQRCGAAGPGPQRDHLDRGVGPHVAVALGVRGRECVDARHGDLVALADVAAVERGLDDRVVADLAAGLVPERLEHARASDRVAATGPRAHELATTRRLEQAHCRQHAGARWHDHRRHPERVGDGARVHRARAAERHEREVARVDAARDRDRAHRFAPSLRRPP